LYSEAYIGNIQMIDNTDAEVRPKPDVSMLATNRNYVDIDIPVKLDY
jgi:hypothetical protein